MALGGGMSCVKYLLFCFNLLFAITGLIILIVGVRAEINAHPYLDISGTNFYSAGPIVLIIVGVVVFIVAFFGCCGAVKENHCMIVTFSVFLLVIFLCELGVGIAGYMKHRDLETSALRYFNETIEEYDSNPDVRKMYNVIQTDLQCCGIEGVEDWVSRHIAIPDSCCGAREITNLNVASCTPTSDSLHKVGCLKTVVVLLQDIAILLGGVGIGIAAVQLLGVIFACCLARSIRREYETV